jgi:Leucine-rich repeat (LRR) protein
MDWQAKKLEILMVRGNDVTQIPTFIQNLTKLKTLRVENCELNSLPKNSADWQD